MNFGGLLEPLCNPRDRQSGLGPPRGEGSTAVGVWEDGFPGSLAGRHSTHISEAGVAASQRILGPPRGWNPALPPGRLFFLLFPSHFPLGNQRLYFRGTHIILFFSFTFIGVQLIYNVRLVSGVQQSDSVTHVYSLFFRFFSHIGYHRVLSGVSCAIQEVPGGYVFLYIVVCVC